MSGAHVDLSANNNNSPSQQTLLKKAFVGTNTSIGRNNRDANIPVRAVSPRVRWAEKKPQGHYYGSQHSQQMSTSHQNKREQTNQNDPLDEIPTAGELLGRTHEELVLLLIQLRRRHAATHRAIEECCTQMRKIEDCLSSLKAMEREESIQHLEQLKMQLRELEHQYEKNKPLVQLVDNMVKLGSLYNRSGSTVERLEKNQRLRQKVLAEHALEQERWLESAAAGKPLESEAARVRVDELWALEQELADEAAILQRLKTDNDAIESILTSVRGKFDSVPRGSITDLSLGGLGNKGQGLNAGSSLDGSGYNGHDLLEPGYNGQELVSPGYTGTSLNLEQSPLSSNSSTGGVGLEAELTQVHAMLAHNSKKLKQTVADNACLERELQELRRALQARRAALRHTEHPTALLEDEVTRVQQLVTTLQHQRQELSRAVRQLTQQSHVLQSTHDFMPEPFIIVPIEKLQPHSSWQETNLDTGSTVNHSHHDVTRNIMQPRYYPNVETPLYVDTRVATSDITSPIQHSGIVNLSNVEKQEIKTVRIVKRESERRQRDRERSLHHMCDWSTSKITANFDQFLEEELFRQNQYSQSTSLPLTDCSSPNIEECFTKPTAPEPTNYLRLNENMKNMELSPKYPSSQPLSNYIYSRDISSLKCSYNKSYVPGYDRTISLSIQYLNSPTKSVKTLPSDLLPKTSSVVGLTPSYIELSPIFKSEAAKQIITEVSNDRPKTGSLHRRQVPKEKRRHYTAPHHLSAKTLSEMLKDCYCNQDKMGRSLDDADMERALRITPAPDVVSSALPTRYANSIDQLLAAPQKILIPERYIPEKPPELSPEEQQKRFEKVESIKKMLSSSLAEPSKSPDGEEKRQREHLLQMNQILAKQVTEMSKIIAVKALEELPLRNHNVELDDGSPDVELPIYQQRENFFT